MMGPFNQMGNFMNNMQAMMQRFQQFRQSFRGDAAKQVQQLLDSGKVSQEQHNQAVQMAQMFQRMMGSK